MEVVVEVLAIKNSQVTLNLPSILKEVIHVKSTTGKPLKANVSNRNSSSNSQF